MRVPPTLLLAMLLAGCASPSADPVADAETPAWLARLADLPCEASVDDAPSANLRVLGHHGLDEPTPTNHRELDHDPTRPLLVAARLTEGGFDVVDTSDPTAPRVVSTWSPADPAYALDVKFTSDGTGVVVASSAHLRIVDMRDPAAPKLESEFALDEEGAHMLATFRVDGVEHVAASKGEGADLSIFALRGEAGARTLERVATPGLTPLSTLPMREDMVRSHDAWAEVDPASGTPLLWVANVWFGVAALDVSDPSAPKLVASWGHDDAYQSYVHTVRVAHLDGKRLVVATSEYGNAAVKVWDATDLDAPRLVATWSLGGDAPHNLQVVGHHAYVTYFEHGFYVLDLSHAASGALPVVARLPASGEYDGVRTPGNLIASYFGPVDILVKDGVLWIGEETTGVTSVAYGCLRAGDPALASRG